MGLCVCVCVCVCVYMCVLIPLVCSEAEAEKSPKTVVWPSGKGMRMKGSPYIEMIWPQR